MADKINLAYVLAREHPVYTDNKRNWERAKAAYSGGKKYVDTALIKHVSEIDLEFEERRKRAYYFNYPRKVARSITQFVFSEEPKRENADPDLVEDFSRTGLRVNEVMRQFSTMLNVYGAAWMLIDNPPFDNGELDIESKAANRIRPYAIALDPLTVVDWAFGSDGLLLWAIIAEDVYTNIDPFNPPILTHKRRLWTRTSWTLFSKGPTGCLIEATLDHNLGIVPLLHFEETDGYGMNCNHWFEDVVRISDAILNNESEAQMNIVKQMFGLLVVSETFARGAETDASTQNDSQDCDKDKNKTKFSHVIARSAAIWEADNEKGISRYIAPTGVETKTIREENINLKKELFDTIGLAVQKDSKTAQSAESKAWDNQNVQQFLATRADILEQVENRAWEIMNTWDNTVVIPKVTYNRDFSITDLKDMIDALLGLDSIQAGEEFTHEVARAGVALLNKINRIPLDTLTTILAEIDKLQPAPVPTPLPVTPVIPGTPVKPVVQAPGISKVDSLIK